MRTVYALLVIAILSALPSAAAAQDLELIPPAGRQGYYLGGGLRQTASTVHASDFGNLGLMFGFGFTLRAGQMVNDLFGFGLAINAGGGGNDDWGGGFGALSLEGQITPLEGEDLAIRASIGLGGLGVARTKPELETEDDPSGTAGTLYTLGVSYDLFPFYEKEKYETGGFAFSGYLEAMLLPGDGLYTVGAMLGLEITYWFGFQRNRLELPPDAAF